MYLLAFYSNHYFYSSKLSALTPEVGGGRIVSSCPPPHPREAKKAGAKEIYRYQVAAKIYGTRGCSKRGRTHPSRRLPPPSYISATDAHTESTRNTLVQSATVQLTYADCAHAPQVHKPAFQGKSGARGGQPSHTHMDLVVELGGVHLRRALPLAGASACVIVVAVTVGRRVSCPPVCRRAGVGAALAAWRAVPTGVAVSTTLRAALGIPGVVARAAVEHNTSTVAVSSALGSLPNMEPQHVERDSGSWRNVVESQLFIGFVAYPSLRPWLHS